MPGDPGLPEKCPAISLDDAGVTEDGGCGVTVRRREQYFMFDREVYRTWSRGTSVWLDGRPDDDSNDSSFQQNDSNCCHSAVNVLSHAVILHHRSTPRLHPLPVAKDGPGPASAAGGRHPP
ncbi:hypothetical protein M0C91_09800 [Methanoculleus sp. 7T]|nr:hypothetical protein [Methanoculleus sp. 7T]